MRILTTLSFATAFIGTALSQTFTVNGVSFEMVEVEGGTFYMGGQRDDASLPNYDADISQYVNTASPVHSVELSTFHIGKYEVTQELWKAALGEELLKTDAGIGAGDNYPAYYMSYNDCWELIWTLNSKLSAKLNGAYFSLPSEAQWEYAARGGKNASTTLYAGSDTSSEVAWSRDNSGQKLSEVGKLKPNALGLYDMSGNAQEWCLDYYFNSYDYFPTGKDPIVTTETNYNIVRGGHFGDVAKGGKVYSRAYQFPTQSNYYTGLRLVLIGYQTPQTAVGKPQSTTDNQCADVFTTGGVLVKKNATPDEIKALPKGTYIINKKLIAK